MKEAWTTNSDSGVSRRLASSPHSLRTLALRAWAWHRDCRCLWSSLRLNRRPKTALLNWYAFRNVGQTQQPAQWAWWKGPEQTEQHSILTANTPCQTKKTGGKNFSLRIIDFSGSANTGRILGPRQQAGDWVKVCPGWITKLIPKLSILIRKVNRTVISRLRRLNKVLGSLFTHISTRLTVAGLGRQLSG